MSKGVPFDVAFALDPHEALAYSVIFGELDGSTFDWSSFEWVRRD